MAGVLQGEVHKGETAAAVELNKKSSSEDSRASVKIWTAAYLDDDDVVVSVSKQSSGS